MKKLFIDLEKCDRCKECIVECNYFYHPQNNGVTSLRELVTLALFCRRCEEAPCVNSCYRNALSKDEQGLLKRARFLCTSCKTCSIACPFGVMLKDFLQFLDSRCDFCLERSLSCIKSCPYKALEIKEIKEEDISQDIYFVSEYLAAHTKKWFKDDAILYKKRRDS